MPEGLYKTYGRHPHGPVFNVLKSNYTKPSIFCPGQIATCHNDMKNIHKKSHNSLYSKQIEIKQQKGVTMSSALVSSTTTLSRPIDLSDFNQSRVFGPNNPLDPAVQSDHAEIAIRTDFAVFNAWNIYNPFTQSFFGKLKDGHTSPFKDTHLYSENSRLHNQTVIAPLMQKKIDEQVETIASRFCRGEVSVQVIIEGYEGFYKQLEGRINELGKIYSRDYEIIRVKRDPNSIASISAILVDTEKFAIGQHGSLSMRYNETANNAGEIKGVQLTLPFAALSHISTGNDITIVAVHIPGVDLQLPENGLQCMAKICDNLWKLNDGSVDVLAMGDYNTTPSFARKFMLSSGGELLNAPYPTHINPFCQVANYDQVFLKPSNEEKKRSYKFLNSSEISPASQALIKSILNGLR